MDALIAIITLALFAGIIVLLSGPLRAARSAPARSAQDKDEAALREHDRDELEAAREAKYREIRDAELDFRTGKLSSEDYRAIDAELRSEAVRILDRIEAAEQAQPVNGAESGEDGGSVQL